MTSRIQPEPKPADAEAASRRGAINLLPKAASRFAPLGFGIVRLVVKRALNNPTLVLFTLLGVIICVALVTAVPFYADGVVERILRVRVETDTSTLPPVAIRIRHREDRSRPTSVEQFRRTDEYVSQSVESVVGLPIRSRSRYLSVSSRRIAEYETKSFNEVWVSTQMRYGEIGTLTDLDEHVRIVEGTSLPSEPLPDGLVPVLVTTTGADELHVKVGERYWFLGPNLDKLEKVGLQIVGIWEPIDPKDNGYWYTTAPETTYQYTLLVSESDFFDRIIPAFPESKPVVNEFSWYVVFDERALDSTKVERVRAGLRDLELDLKRLMPDVTIPDTPLDTLDWFSRQVASLRTLLLILSLPLLAIALYYVSVSLSMVMEQQRGEIAFLRSRGASPHQIVLIYLVESAFIGFAALALGVLAGMLVAQVIGAAFGFLLFAKRAPLPIAVSPEVLGYAAVAVVLAVLCTLYPAIKAARLSIVAYVQTAARTERYISLPGLVFDLFWVAIATYGYFSLRAGTLAVRVNEQGNYVLEPLLLVLPAVSICALALVFRRFVPLIGLLAAKLVARLGGAPTLLALREVYRAPGAYSALVFLLVVTLAIGIYSASAARTLETNFADRARYLNPAEVEVVPAWEVDTENGGLLEPPHGAFDVPGIRALSRRQNFTGRLGDARGGQDVQVMGIEAQSFADVAWWRDDFASVSPRDLLRPLMLDERNIVVSNKLLAERQLRRGDVINVEFTAAGTVEPKSVEFVIADAVDLFPTLYAERGPFAIANLSYIHDQVGLGMYDVLLALEPGFGPKAVLGAIEANGIVFLRVTEQRIAINVGRLDPQRTGILGLLSLTFIVSALLTVLGYTLHTLLTLRQRTPQMGVLRTMGLSSGQLVRLLVTEQAFVVSVSVAAGVAIGALASQLFVPFLQVDIDRLGQTPPFIVQNAWEDVRWIVLVLALMLVAGTAITYALSRRMRLNQAVQLGSRM